MDHDFMSRGYLLPKGCKDLIDAMKLKASCLPAGYEPQVLIIKPNQPPKILHPLPPIVGEIIVPIPTTVSQLASLLGQKPFQIIADIMRLGVFAFVDQVLDFKTISDIARKYGYLAIKPA